ncbi:MAG: hypothetical protein Q7R95_10770 [bacterium]|nr:hypothetical protein [bacterium]
MNEDTGKYIEQLLEETDFFSKAKFIDFLIKKKGLRIVDISEIIQKQPSYVCHILRLNRVPELIMDGYYSNLISLSQLFIISRIKDDQKMIHAYEKILTDNLTVLQTEAYVREILYNVKTNSSVLKKDEENKFIKDIECNNPGIKINIIQTRIRGKIEIEVKGSLTESSKKLTILLKKLL